MRSSIPVRLFANTEPAKDITKQFIICDLAGDLTKVVQCFPDVDGDKVGGDIIAESFLDAEDRFNNTRQGFVMAGIGHDHTIFIGVESNGLHKAI